MRLFLEDFDEGREAGRYQSQALPKLSFEAGDFDLAVSSHFLFLYSDQLDLSFHINGVDELLRVSREVRIFPLLDLNGERSAHLDPLIAGLAGEGHCTEIREVPYEFQIGGNEMLRVSKR